MLKAAKRLYILVPVLGLVLVSEFAKADAAKTPATAPMQCSNAAVPASLTNGPIPGELKPTKFSDLNEAKPTGSKLNNAKMTVASIIQKVLGNYGPLSPKLQELNPQLDIPKMTATYLKRAGQAKSPAELMTIITDFMSEFRDSHISVQLPSDLLWRLPIQADFASGKMLVRAAKGTNHQPAGTRLPGVGDEIVSINGQTPEDFRHTFSRWNANANETTNDWIYALGFGGWSEASGLPLSLTPMDALQLTMKTPKGETYQTTLKFEKSGVGLDNVMGPDSQPAPVQSLAQIEAKTKFRRLRRIAPHTAAILQRFHNLMRAEVQKSPWALPKETQQQDPTLKGRPVNLGDSQPFFDLPVGFKDLTLPPQIAQSQLANLFDMNFFKAGTFTRNGQTIGFLRIPSFSPDDLSTMLPMYRFLIGNFELMKQQGKISKLIIDQTHNPGGYVIMSDLVVKSLVGKFDETKHLRYAVKATRSNFLREYIELREEISANADGLLTADQVADFTKRLDVAIAEIKSAQADGRDLSNPISMLVMSEYTQLSLDAQMKKLMAQSAQAQGPNGQPVKVSLGDVLNKLLGVDVSSEQVFTGDVVYWIDPLCFSGGDATPATLQDYGRVRLIGIGGDRTAGAGGTVEEFQTDQSISMLIRMTTSLMVRKDMTLVENWGVHATQSVAILPSDIVDSGMNLFERIMHETIDQPGAAPVLSQRLRFMQKPLPMSGPMKFKQTVSFVMPKKPKSVKPSLQKTTKE